jgi:4-hydroxy-tetrahydrodipicolinate synthase
MDRTTLRSLLVGSVVTVPTPFDDDFELDLGRMAEATRFWVDSGLVTGKAIIKVAAAMGEGPMLCDWEWPPLLRTVVQNAGGKAAIVCGIQYKDTKRAIEDSKRAQDLGAIGVQIAPPVMCGPTQDDTLRYFEAISKAIEIGIIVYDHPWYPHGNIEMDTYFKMRAFEHVVAIKWPLCEQKPYEEMRRLTADFNIFDNGGGAVRCHQLGGHGFISDTGMAYPEYDLKLWDLLVARRYAEAEALHQPVKSALYGFYGRIGAKSGGQGRATKGLMMVRGLPMGSSRPPSLPLSADELAELRRIVSSLGWPVGQS